MADYSLQESISPAGRSAGDYISLTAFGLISLCGAMVTFMGLATIGNENGLAGLFLGLAPFLAGLSSMGLIWFRNTKKPFSIVTVGASILWFLGVSLAVFGGFAALTPSEQGTVANLGFSAALCFTPGGFLALLGLGLYWYDRNRKTNRISQTQKRSGTIKKEKLSPRAEKVQRAEEYLALINSIVKESKSSNFAGQLNSISEHLTHWETRWRELVKRLDKFEANTVLQRDIAEVPAKIADLESQIETETSPAVQAQMEETLAGYQKHHSHLQALSEIMRRTEFEIDESLAAIAALYSQLQMLGAKDIDSARAKRLSDELDEHSNQLDDLMLAMDEVYTEFSDPA